MTDSEEVTLDDVLFEGIWSLILLDFEDEGLIMSLGKSGTSRDAEGRGSQEDEEVVVG